MKLPTLAEVNAVPHATPKGRAKVADRIAYKKARERVLSAARTAAWQRCGGRCEDCGTALIRGRVDSLRAAHFHHVTFRSQGGKDTAANLVAICAKCHATRHGLRVS